MTHVSVIIWVYKYNLQLEIEPWAAVVNSYTDLKSRHPVKLNQNLNNLL